MTDWDYLQQYAKYGSEEAFSKIVENHQDMVYSLCYRYTFNATMAEDVTQAVFLMLAKKSKSIQPGSNIAGWLFKAAKFASMSAKRNETRLKKREEQLSERANVIHDENQQKQLWQRIEPHLNDALSSLNEKYRSAVILKFYENQKHKYIGSALNISENAAQKILAKALVQLRKYLARKDIQLNGVILGELLNEHSKINTPLSLTTPAISSVITNAQNSVVTNSITLLAEGAIKMMVLAKIKFVAVSVAMLTILGGVGYEVHHAIFPDFKAVEKLQKTNGQDISHSKLKRLKGKWQFYKIGKTDQHEELEDAWLEITEKSISFLKDRDFKLWNRIALNINSEAHPKEIDIPIGKNNAFQGIYELKNDLLSICVNTKEPRKRPRRFEKSSSQMIVTLLKDTNTTPVVSAYRHPFVIKMDSWKNINKENFSHLNQKWLEHFSDSENRKNPNYCYFEFSIDTKRSLDHMGNFKVYLGNTEIFLRENTFGDVLSKRNANVKTYYYFLPDFIEINAAEKKKLKLEINYTHKDGEQVRHMIKPF